ncbi:hypothetical protein PHISCL_02733 [Aspergillus sclerotialis]|uniref:Uncharacterized protein n=1 Tax=Aspergillus sclerotialis TaxID=2070753 RepID=A0A3A3A6B9_9EURO|nr:hypothetical protein PHISCL_02733 [Aspergillus sclerotialis]
MCILEDDRGYYQRNRLCGFQVSTNHGRTASFVPLNYRLSVAVKPILIPSPGHTITGLVAIKEINRDRFIQIGAQSQQCNEQLTPPTVLENECHEVPEEQLRYDGSHFICRSNPGNYQTYASLKGVRKIRASAGIRGRSRSPSRISGLKFEYYNHPSPGIVGQWMDELEDAFELKPDEEVQTLTIWLTPTGLNTESPGMEVGQVAAIRIETTLSRSMTFYPPEFNSLPSNKLYHRYQSAPCEK